MICRSSLGTNLGVILILLIFGVLFSLPLKILFTSSYGVEEKDSVPEMETESPVDFRSLRLCRNFDYKSTILRSVLFSDYDRNCTRVKLPVPRSTRLGQSGRSISANSNVEESEATITTNNKKSMSIAGHILALMLIGSAVAALVEVLRAHFCTAKEHRADGNPPTRRPSLGDFAQRRHVRKDTMQAQRSFEIQGLMHRSPLRLLVLFNCTKNHGSEKRTTTKIGLILAARPPPLLRRSSFPAQCLIPKDLPISTSTVTGRLSRRPSFAVDSEEDFNSISDFRRHSRLIRRH